MSNLFLTLVIAFVVIVIAIACLAIGWLITGKTKIERGACGRDPTKKRSDECNPSTSCNLCSSPHEESDQKEVDLEQQETTDHNASPKP